MCHARLVNYGRCRPGRHGPGLSNGRKATERRWRGVTLYLLLPLLAVLLWFLMRME